MCADAPCAGLQTHFDGIGHYPRLMPHLCHDLVYSRDIVTLTAMIEGNLIAGCF